MSVEQHNDQQVENNEAMENNEVENEINVDDVMKRLAKLESTNERLLEESKTYKNKWQSLRSKVEQDQEKVLTEQEQWKELLEIEKNKNFETVEKLNKIKKATLKEKLKFDVASHAKDAIDINDVIQLLPRDMIQIDEENLSVQGVDVAVEQLKKSKPHLFSNGKKGTGMVGHRPVGDNGKRSFEELSKKEQDDLFEQAIDQWG